MRNDDRGGAYSMIRSIAGTRPLPGAIDVESFVSVSGHATIHILL